MKSLEELKKLRDEAKARVSIRDIKDGYRVTVGMATCGIAAGARPILNKLIEVANQKELDNVRVTQVGCIGACEYEPIVEVINTDGKKTTYCLVDETKAVEIVEKHIIGGEEIEAYKLINNKD